MKSILIIGLGFFAQGLFFIRTIAQWFKSEKEGEVISPVIYWQISLVASIMMLTYGILRHDFAIVIGQSLVYGIYIRNLQLKNVWNKMYWALKVLALAIPVLYWIWLLTSGSFATILHNQDVSL
ncbi:MAG TPA: lipid-A-disaccharide synthase N-terminal domain-containing protein, partial [Draconibacterium sp.]|nr:lipid-A-disaccharide synthase N-terminal domain-containing protein [Draconibacterium sp.]